jgi:hypothetical protein
MCILRILVMLRKLFEQACKAAREDIYNCAVLVLFPVNSKRVFAQDIRPEIPG